MAVSYVYKLSWTGNNKHYIGYRDQVDAADANTDLNAFSFELPAEVQTYIASNGNPDTKTVIYNNDAALTSNFIRLMIKDDVYSNTALINNDILNALHTSANSFNKYIIDEFKTKVLIGMPL